MITIQKSKNADNRTAEGLVTHEELLEASKQHIDDVRKGMSFFIYELADAGLKHDHTKIDDIDLFHQNFIKLKPSDFVQGYWYRKHIAEERHHLNSRVPDDITLIDVLEHLTDIVMAGMARSGSVWSDTLPPEVLELAYKNTIELLKNNVEVV